MNDTNNEKDILTKWLLTEIQSHLSYHNHKEYLAWIITTFYIIALFSLNQLSGDIKSPWQIGILIAVIFVFSAVVTLVNMQFRMRWQSSDQLNAFRSAIVKISNLSNNISDEDLKINYKKRIDGSLNIWPKFVLDEIIKCRTSRNIKCIDLIKDIYYYCTSKFKKDKQVNDYKLDNRWKTEIPSYVIMVVATMIYLLNIFL